MSNNRFDQEAAEWDIPMVKKCSENAFASLLEHVPRLADEDDAKNLDVLEIGCGTGLLSLQVAPRVNSLTAVDPSSGMIKVLESKLAANSIDNIDPLCVTLETPDDPALKGKKFDLILSHLVLHHIPSLENILEVMYSCLKPGGSIALTDFERFGPEAEKFHPASKMDGVQRHGITKMEMECFITEAGFNKVQVCQAFVMDKEIEPSGSMEFPFLICMGVKKK